jgi:hypothetical protein
VANEFYRDPDCYPIDTDEKYCTISEVVATHKLKRYDVHPATAEDTHRCDCEVGDDIYSLKMEPVEEPEPWIKLSERLPDKDQKIYTTYEGEDYVRVVWQEVWWDGDYVNPNAIAWMPRYVPKPYQGER